MKAKFNSPKAQALYNKYAADSDVYQHGIDSTGKIYFAYVNGVVKRYTRREFLQMANNQ